MKKILLIRIKFASVVNQAIKEDMDYKELKVDDMKWIDQSMKEDPNVSS